MVEPASLHCTQMFLVVWEGTSSTGLQLSPLFSPASLPCRVGLHHHPLIELSPLSSSVVCLLHCRLSSPVSSVNNTSTYAVLMLTTCPPFSLCSTHLSSPSYIIAQYLSTPDLFWQIGGHSQSFLLIPNVWGCRLYEWICKFIHQGIVKCPKYGRQQHHELCKLDCKKYVTETTQGKIYTI